MHERPVRSGLEGWKPVCAASHPKQARYQDSLQPDSGNIFSILAQLVARALPLPGTTSGRPHKPLALPSRYQATINLLKTHDKLARGRDLVAARLGGLQHRYLPALAVDRRGNMPASKRILDWDLSAWKPEPLIQAEAVVTLFYYMQRVAPQVWSDLITQASSATTQEDLEKAVAVWTAKWRLCGPTGPTEWALLIGFATAKAVLSVPAIQLPPNVDIFICICADPRSSLTHRRIVSARRLLVGIDVARSMFFASTLTPICC